MEAARSEAKVLNDGLELGRFQRRVCGSEIQTVSAQLGTRSGTEAPRASPSQMITSVSTLQWTKNASVERRTVPRIPIRQCSIVGVNSEVG